MGQIPIPSTVPPNARLRVLYLHDHLERTLADSDPLALALRSRGLSIHCPNGGSTWWLDRIVPEYDPARSAESIVVGWLREQSYPVAALGGEAAFRIAFRYPRLIPVVAGWDCAFDFHELIGRGTMLDRHFERQEQARQHTAILQIRANDPPRAIWFGCPPESENYRGHDRLHEKLAAVGVAHEFVVAEECPVEAIADFLRSGLEREARRLL